MNSQEEYEQAAKKYASWVEDFDSPAEFYAALRKDGVGNAISCFLLRDYYDQGIDECLEIAEEYKRTIID